MTLTSGYTLVSPGKARIDEFLAVDAWAFIFEPRDIDLPQTWDVLPADRARAVEITDAAHGPVGSFAGVYSSATYGMRLPGGKSLTTSGLTWVGVHPGHRRRGHLRAMIDDHFRMSLEAGESVSTLYAMETAIYGRFGYGSCAPRYRVKAGALKELEGSDDLSVRFERADREAHEPIVRAVHARMSRPGTVVDPAPTMLADMLQHFPSDLHQNERFIMAIAEDAQGPVGYARFRRKFDQNEENPNPTAKIHVPNLSAATPVAARRIVAALLDLDLISEVTIEALAPDDPVLELSLDVRALKAILLDGMWLRILDLPTALAERRYEQDADVVVEVSDQQLPANAGRWRIKIVAGVAVVTRTTADADVSLSIQDLSAAYLGRDHVRRAFAAGTITESRPGAVRELNAALVTTQEPYSNMWF